MYVLLIVAICLGVVYQSESCNVTLEDADAESPDGTQTCSYKFWFTFADGSKWNFAQKQRDWVDPGKVSRVADEGAFNGRVGQFGGSFITVPSLNNAYFTHAVTTLYVRFKITNSVITSGVDVIVKYGKLTDDTPSLFLGYDRAIDRVVFKTLVNQDQTTNNKAAFMSFDAEKEKWIEVKVRIDGVKAEVELESVVGCGGTKETNMKYLPTGNRWKFLTAGTSFSIGGGDKEQHTTILYQPFYGLIDFFSLHFCDV